MVLVSGGSAAVAAADDAEDEGGNEQHDADNGEPEQTLERESHDRQHHPNDEQDEKSYPHIRDCTLILKNN